MIKAIYELDMTPRRTLPIIINVSQYDDIGRTLVFNLFSSSGKWTAPTSAAVTFEGGKPDGKFFAYNCAYSNGTVTVTIQQQMTAVAGKVRCKVKVKSGDKVVESAPVIMVVDAAAVPDGSDMSKSDINDAIANATQKIVDQVKDNIPLDYSQLSTDVSSLKQDLGDLGLNLYSDISKNILKMKDVAETSFNGLNYSVTDNIVTLKGTTNKAGTLYLDLESDINAGNYFFNNFMKSTILLSGVSCGLIKDEDYSHIVGLSLGTVDNKAISVTSQMNRMYIYFPANATSDAIYKMCITSERTNKYIPKNVYAFAGIMDDLITENNEKLRSEFTPKDPTVINCWGDSLTMGAGAKIGETDYPTVLKTMLQDYKVNNYGVGGQRAEQIALRMSAIPAYVKPFTVPVVTSATDIPIKLYSTGGYNANFGDSTFAVGTGTNNVRIGDFEGPLVVNSESKLCLRVYWNATEKKYSRPMRVYPASIGKRNDIVIIWVGTNNINDTVEHIIDVQKLMVSTVTSGKYIIVGLTAKTYFDDIANYNRKMYQTFGEHFIDIRKYILDYGLSDAGITPTKSDEQAIQSGEMPPSLIYQGDGYGVHFLPAGYKIVAAQIYKKGVELGYWD